MNSVKPFFSIVIPIYNSEKYLKECLKSIQIQVFKNYEVILVNDGSTDSSGKICKSFSEKDSRFKYYEIQNSGSFAARLYGLNKVQGTYFLFCDSDDYYVNKKVFSLLHDYLKDENITALQFQFQKKYNHIKTKENKIKQKIILNSTDFFHFEFPSLLCNTWENSRLTGHHPNKAYHSKLISSIRDINPNERVFFCEDIITNIHLLRHCDSFCFIPEALYCYRCTVGGTKKFSKSHMNDLNIIKQYQMSFLEKYNQEHQDKILNKMHAETSAWFFLWIQDALQHLSIEDLKDFIEKTLQLPSFVEARRYYLTKCDESWEAVDLLRAADPLEYIKHAKAANELKNKKSIRNILLKLIKKI